MRTSLVPEYKNRSRYELQRETHAIIDSSPPYEDAKRSNKSKETKDNKDENEILGPKNKQIIIECQNNTTEQNKHIELCSIDHM